jgi:cysteine desulfurase/selenocysteine lyase
MTETLSDLRACFPVSETWIYFNHAAVCPLATPVARAVESFLADAVANGSTGFRTWDAKRASARRQIAALVGCREMDVALTTSTSQGLIAVAEGLPLASDDEIIVIEDDFPANRIPWFRQEKRGARIVEVPRDVAGRVTSEAILERVNDRTRILAIPYVLFDNGYRIDLEAVGRGLGDHPAWFCVDAIQGLGAFPMDMAGWRIDALSADSHKWMLGTEGIGLFCVRAERLDELDSPLVSWFSMAQPFAPWQRGAPLREDARRHEFASLPTALVFGLDACLELLLSTGVDAISQQVLALTDALVEGLTARGWEVRSPRGEPARCSGIVSAAPPTGSPDEAVAALEAAHVSVTPRGGAVRFSPHGWNTLDEVGSLLERLP